VRRIKTKNLQIFSSELDLAQAQPWIHHLIDRQYIKSQQNRNFWKVISPVDFDILSNNRNGHGTLKDPKKKSFDYVISHCFDVVSSCFSKT
jgi:hypothetical protein